MKMRLSRADKKNPFVGEIYFLPSFILRQVFFGTMYTVVRYPVFFDSV